MHPHPYPMVRTGGLFLTLIGLGLIAAVLDSGAALVDYRIFFGGLVLALGSLALARPLSLGRPTTRQRTALGGAIALEIVLFGVLRRLLPPGTTESAQWLWMSLVVGVHFVPMALAFGPRLLLLGGFCIACAAAGLLAPAAPAGAFLLLDGAAKVACGAWLFSDGWRDAGGYRARAA